MELSDELLKGEGSVCTTTGNDGGLDRMRRSSNVAFFATGQDLLSLGICIHCTGALATGTAMAVCKVPGMGVGGQCQWCTVMHVPLTAASWACQLQYPPHVGALYSACELKDLVMAAEPVSFTTRLLGR